MPAATTGAVSVTVAAVPAFLNEDDSFAAFSSPSVMFFQEMPWRSRSRALMFLDTSTVSSTALMMTLPSMLTSSLS